MVDASYRPVCDLVAKAEIDLPAGHVLDIVGTRHAVPGLEPLLMDAMPAEGSNPLPYYMAVGRRLARPVKAGEFITADAVEPPGQSVLWRLRAEQDAAFRRA
jgi:predicted homoserine dehydrogenase-like protein